MTLHIEYLTDSKGKTKSIVIPQKEWEAFQKEFIKLKNKLDVLLGIQSAMNEVKIIREGKKKAKTLSQLLNE